jgi:hypothetical protein
VGLSFRNNTPDGIYLAVLMYDPSCPGGDPGQPFSGHGWYRIEAGQTREVVHGDVGDYNRWWGFEAESDAGAVWAGEFTMIATDEAFSHCYSLGVSGASARPIGFRGLLMDDDYDDYTVPLVL